MEETTVIAAVTPTCRSFTVPKQTLPVRWYVVHDEQERIVHGDAVNIIAPDKSMFGRQCDSIRSAGFLQAYRDGAKFILTVDDDCFVPLDWAERHRQALEIELRPWWTTVGLRTRGMPRLSESPRIALSHGVWDGVPDLDAETQSCFAHRPLGAMLIRNRNIWERIGYPFPQSAMNLGFRREFTPLMYQPAQGPDEGFDRFADIWGGLLAQKCLSLHNYAAMNGGAVVYHTRASNVDVNIKKEEAGARIHEHFWIYVWNFNRRGVNIGETYAMLADHVAKFDGDYFKRTAERMHRWLTLLAR